MSDPSDKNSLLSGPASAPEHRGLLPVAPQADADRVRTIADRGIERYIARRREKIQPFVDFHYSWSGSFRLHRHAVGGDLWRAPANVALAVPTLASRLSGEALRWRSVPKTGEAVPPAPESWRKRWGDRLARTDISFPTRVGKEIEWALYNELLELPCQVILPGGETRTRSEDALAATILDDPAVSRMLETVLLEIGEKGADPAFRERLTESLVTYAGTRAAAGEIASGLLTLGVGAASLQQFTPGALSLGPALATIMAQQAAIASFPLGTSLGGVWYSMFSVTASPLLTLGVTGGLMLGASVLVAFAGVITDPLQRHAGLHQKRLHRLVDTLEASLQGRTDARFVVRDHYAARLLDLIDMMRSIHRLQ